MSEKVSVTQEIAAGYTTSGGAVDVGSVVVDGTADPAARVRIPLATMNRHGLVAGATGTGKTKTLQGIAEQPGCRSSWPTSRATCPVSPRRVPRTTGSPHARPTPATTGRRRPSRPVPVARHVRHRRAGPLMLAKVLGLNKPQESTLGLIFHWADGKGLPLLDTKDLRAVITYLTSQEGKADLQGIGGVSRRPRVSSCVRCPIWTPRAATSSSASRSCRSRPDAAGRHQPDRAEQPTRRRRTTSWTRR